jgi:D-tyrosyl-tRNA(Tyr) deacylase
MKVLVQRVTRASVRVEGEIIGEIGPGLLVFLGVERGDVEADVDYMVDKTAGLRIFRDSEGRMNRSVQETSGSVLVVSQFTLAASTRRGRRPSFVSAADPAEAEHLYELFAERLADRGVPVVTGVFQAMMEVELVNDGPVTLMLDPRPGSDEARQR